MSAAKTHSPAVDVRCRTHFEHELLLRALHCLMLVPQIGRHGTPKFHCRSSAPSAGCSWPSGNCIGLSSRGRHRCNLSACIQECNETTARGSIEYPLQGVLYTIPLSSIGSSIARVRPSYVVVLCHHAVVAFGCDKSVTSVIEDDDAPRDGPLGELVNRGHKS